VRRLGLLAFVVGCGGKELTYESDVAPIFEANGCLSCHLPGGEGSTLDLQTDPCGALIGVPATQCMGTTQMNFVEPGDHLYSYLWNKLYGTQMIAGGNGTRMPLRLPVLTAEELLVISNWIDEGAECEN
jgi:hypothetical protein